MMNYKLLSEQYQIKHGIKPYTFLPELEFEGVCVRKTEDVAIRLVILCLIVEVAFNRMTGRAALDYFKNFELLDHVTRNERKFLIDSTPNMKVFNTWKVECSCVLFWYLGLIQELPDHNNLFDISKIDTYPIESLKSSPWGFINRKFVTQRSTDVFFYVDLYSRLDYYCDMCKINKYVLLADSALVYERRYVLNWLTDFTEQEWDSISCDSIY